MVFPFLFLVYQALAESSAHVGPPWRPFCVQTHFFLVSLPQLYQYMFLQGQTTNQMIRLCGFKTLFPFPKPY